MTPVIAKTVHDRATAITKLQAYLNGARARSEQGISRIFTEVPEDRLVRGDALQFTTPGSGQVQVIAPWAANMHENALGQMVGRMDIPMQMIRHLQEISSKTVATGPLAQDWAGELLVRTLRDHAVNVLGTDRFLVRSVGTSARAFLSDKYRRIDSRPGLEMLISVAQQQKAIVTDVVASDVRNSVRVLLPKVYEIAEGEFVALGLSYNNSDFGKGAQTVSLFIMRLWCLNGAMLETQLRSVHLGARLGEGVDYSAETHKLDADATRSAIRDTAMGLLSEVRVDETVNILQRAANEPVDAKAKFADLRKRLGKGTADKIAEAYLTPDVEMLPPGNTAWRLSNAISWVAGQVDTTADERIDLEREAGAALVLPAPKAATAAPGAQA